MRSICFEALADDAAFTPFRYAKAKVLTRVATRIMLSAKCMKEDIRVAVEESSMTAGIIGWAHTPFRRLDKASVETLLVGGRNAALHDAGLAARDGDAT